MYMNWRATVWMEIHRLVEDKMDTIAKITYFYLKNKVLNL